MSAPRLVPLASFVIDVMVLGQALPAASERSTMISMPSTPIVFYPGDAAELIAHRPAESQAQSAAKREVASQALTAGSDDNVQKGKIPSDAPGSILQLVEGHETELLMAVAIAAAFFAVGWICGGNYYLRRDRRLRTKLRF